MGIDPVGNSGRAGTGIFWPEILQWIRHADEKKNNCCGADIKIKPKMNKQNKGTQSMYKVSVSVTYDIRMER